MKEVDYDKPAEGGCVMCKGIIWADKNGRYMCYKCQELEEKLK